MHPLILFLAFISSTWASTEKLFLHIRNEDVKSFQKVVKIAQQNSDFSKWINTREESSRQTPLMMAVLMGQTEIVKFLLGFDAVDVTIPEKDGYTAMHGAGFQGRAEILKLLLEDSRGIDPSHMHSDGFTPLHRACWGDSRRHTETVKTFILDGGVDIKEKSRDGDTCYDVTHNKATKSFLKELSKKEEL